jgi:hypothetical protein
MSDKTKTPKAGEWWRAKDLTENAFICGFDEVGDPVVKRAADIYDYEMSVFLHHWHHEPRCDSFDWVEPPAIDPGEGWEVLPHGTLIEDGDEVLDSDGDWVETGYAGDVSGGPRTGEVYRRKIKPAEVWPKWYVPNWKNATVTYFQVDDSSGKGVARERSGILRAFHSWDDTSGNTTEVTEAEALARVTQPDTSRPKNIHGTANDADESPVESPDDWVTQDRVPVRPVFDECRWSSWGDNDVWIRNNDNTYTWMHGRTEKLDGGNQDAVLSVRCLRKDLPAKQPAAKRVPVRLWVRNDACSHANGAIVIAKPESPDDEMIELLHDGDGFYVEAES